jgi:hypothetical protein
MDKPNEQLKDLVYANLWLSSFFPPHNELAVLKKRGWGIEATFDTS